MLLMMFQPLMGWSLLQLRNLLRPWVPAPLRFVKASKTIWEVDNIKRSTPPGERLLKSKLEVLRLEDLQRPGGVPLVSQNGELHAKGCEAGDPIVRILNVCFSGFPVSLGLACQGKLIIMIPLCFFYCWAACSLDESVGKCTEPLRGGVGAHGPQAQQEIECLEQVGVQKNSRTM